jgi:hypothetical protein
MRHGVNRESEGGVGGQVWIDKARMREREVGPAYQPDNIRRLVWDCHPLFLADRLWLLKIIGPKPYPS